MPADHISSDDAERTAYIHREVLKLGALLLVAVAAFFVTRVVAASNRDMNLRDAAEWYRRGQGAIAAGRIDDAIDAFRRASVRNRTDTRYGLPLARALALNHDDEAARSALLTLRESAPEDAEINLELARLAAARQDVTEALRFYHNALYAPWPLEQTDARRGVRLELIAFLLAHNQTNRALSELLALSADVPDEVPRHLEVARLFVRAGDNRHALDHYQRVLRLVPDNGDGLAGAGLTAFQLGEYALARRYLRRAPAEADGVASTREEVELVLSRDPLESRIGSAERRRRLVANFSHAQERLNTCLPQRADSQATGEGPQLQSEAQAFENRLTRPANLEQDTVEMGADLIYRMEQHVVQQCGPPTALDRALLLIGRQHKGEAR